MKDYTYKTLIGVAATILLAVTFTLANAVVDIKVLKENKIIVKETLTEIKKDVRWIRDNMRK